MPLYDIVLLSFIDILLVYRAYGTSAHLERHTSPRTSTALLGNFAIGAFSIFRKEPYVHPFSGCLDSGAAFTKMGAMSVQIAILTSALNTVLILVIAAAAYMVWQRRKA